MTSIARVLQHRQPKVCFLPPQATVTEAADLLAARGVGALLVVHRGCLVGVFSERDLLRRVIARRLDPESTPLVDVMTPEVVTARPDDDRLSAISKMHSAGCCHLPIVVEGAVIDVLSMRDLLREEMEDRSAEVDQLRQYICGVY